ncbi:hypothetical protein IW150_000375, partial [Coemansia sp. RSA 2607]
MRLFHAKPEHKLNEDPSQPSMPPEIAATDSNSLSNLGLALTPTDSVDLLTPDDDIGDKPHPYLLRFGPWWHFCSARDRRLHKTRILPSAAAILMPITVLFVLTSVEANWIMSGPGYNGLRLRKATG